MTETVHNQNHNLFEGRPTMLSKQLTTRKDVPIGLGSATIDTQNPLGAGDISMAFRGGR